MPHIDPSHVLWKEVDGLVVVLLISSGHFIELNRVGSHIWKLVAAGKPKDEIIDAVRKSFDAPKEKIASDVDEFITKAVSQGLLSA